LSAAANARLIERFYGAFARRDAVAMAACYAPDATFADPVFDLRGSEVGAMWSMLCARGRDLRIEAGGIAADDRQGRAHWEARYTFAATGRPVHNAVDAEFTFDGGLIAAHRDRFAFWRWCSMALGLKGALLGWAPVLRNAVRANARGALDTWIAAHGSAAGAPRHDGR
jgi:ketosteroid isomerase-like protein